MLSEMKKKSGYKYIVQYEAHYVKEMVSGLQWRSLDPEIWGDFCTHHYTFRSLFSKLSKISWCYFENWEEITLRINNFT